MKLFHMKQITRTVYVFLVKRPIDSQAWPCVPFESRERAEAYPHRASPVVPVHLDEIDPLNLPMERKAPGPYPPCQCESCSKVSTNTKAGD